MKKPSQSFRIDDDGCSSRPPLKQQLITISLIEKNAKFLYEGLHGRF